MFEGRAAIGYDHGYDAQKFYLGLALDSKYVKGFMEGCLERIGEDEDCLRSDRENGDYWEFVLDAKEWGGDQTGSAKKRQTMLTALPEQDAGHVDEPQVFVSVFPTACLPPGDHRRQRFFRLTYQGGRA